MPFGVDSSTNNVHSARLFRRQFTDKWHFPPRKPRMSDEDKEIVVDRMRQLWEQNLPLADIRSTLDDEGWELGDNEFQRLRKGNGLIKRGMVGAYDTAAGVNKKKRKRGEAQAEDEVGPADGEYWTGIGIPPSVDAKMARVLPGFHPPPRRQRGELSTSRTCKRSLMPHSHRASDAVVSVGMATWAPTSLACHRDMAQRRRWTSARRSSTSQMTSTMAYVMSLRRSARIWTSRGRRPLSRPGSGKPPKTVWCARTCT